MLVVRCRRCPLHHRSSTSLGLGPRWVRAAAVEYGHRRAPNANAYAERWVRTVRTECLDWLLIVGCGHLEQVLRIYVRHYNEHRPHRALGLKPPNPHAAGPVSATRRALVRRRDLLDGLVHEYQRAA
jgi:putative transposase